MAAMPILIAEDDPVSCTALERTLVLWGHTVTVVSDGHAAWEVLQREDAPPLAILDWMMPGLDGVELCRRYQELGRTDPTYLILLTARNETDDVVKGLESGANDYVTKPFDRRELKSRVRVGQRVVTLQHELSKRVRELEQALSQVGQLEQLLPICYCCRRVRDEESYWQKVESYVTAHTEICYVNSICPGCYRTL